MSRPSRALDVTSVQVYTREIRKLASDMRDCKKQNNDVKKLNSKLLIENKTLNKQVEKLRGDRGVNEIDEEHEKEVKFLKEIIEEKEHTIQKLEHKLKGLEMEKKEVQSMHNAQEGEINQLRDDITRLREQVDTLNYKLQNSQTEREEKMALLVEAFGDQFRDVFNEFREEMKDVKSAMIGMHSEMKDFKSLKSEIIEEVTELVRNELVDRPETRVVNYNISSHVPLKPWE